jgi:hypothetical protein
MRGGREWRVPSRLRRAQIVADLWDREKGALWGGWHGGVSRDAVVAALGEEGDGAVQCRFWWSSRVLEISVVRRGAVEHELAARVGGRWTFVDDGAPECASLADLISSRGWRVVGDKGLAAAVDSVVEGLREVEDKPRAARTLSFSSESHRDSQTASSSWPSEDASSGRAGGGGASVASEGAVGMSTSLVLDAVNTEVVEAKSSLTRCVPGEVR